MRDAVVVPSAQLAEQRLKRKIAMITNSYVISALEWLTGPKQFYSMVVTAEKKGLSPLRAAKWNNEKTKEQTA